MHSICRPENVWNCIFFLEETSDQHHSLALKLFFFKKKGDVTDDSIFLFDFMQWS
jgi:hypothetical protein